MTPEVPAVLYEMAALLVRNAVPGVPDAERASALTLSSMLLVVAAEVWDAAAQNLVQENRELANLLGDDAAEGDLHLSVLRAENSRLRAGLIAAHIAAEDADDQTRQDAIWAQLRTSTERRLLSISLV
jgi:hypothetical protein